jgi:hypothetical protein
MKKKIIKLPKNWKNIDLTKAVKENIIVIEYEKGNLCRL